MADRPRYPTFGDCRRLGHAWFDVPSDWKATIGVPLTYRCDRCGTERREQVGRNTGELVTRHYAYPEGYSYAKGEAPTRDDFRRMFIDQMMRRQREARRRAKEASAA